MNNPRKGLGLKLWMALASGVEVEQWV